MLVLGMKIEPDSFRLLFNSLNERGSKYGI